MCFEKIFTISMILAFLAFMCVTFFVFYRSWKKIEDVPGLFTHLKNSDNILKAIDKKESGYIEIDGLKEEIVENKPYYKGWFFSDNFTIVSKSRSNDSARVMFEESIKKLIESMNTAFTSSSIKLISEGDEDFTNTLRRFIARSKLSDAFSYLPECKNIIPSCYVTSDKITIDWAGKMFVFIPIEKK